MTVLALAHPSLTGMTSGTGTSGSTGWSNAVRARTYLHSDKDDDDARTLQVMKANYGPKNLSVKLRWQRGLYVPITEAAQMAKDKCSAEAAEECFMRLLDTYTAEGRNVSTSPSVTYARQSSPETSGAKIVTAGLSTRRAARRHERSIRVRRHRQRGDRLTIAPAKPHH